MLKALSPLVLDLVLCDDGRPYLGVMLWPVAGADPGDVARRLAEFNADQRGGATRVRRALLLSEPPSANAHEISDKGSINRRVVVDRRASDVERLFAETPDAGVMALG